MRTFTSLALVAALGLGAATLSKPAEAGVVVGVGLPGVAVGASAMGTAAISCVAASREFNDARNSRSPAVASRVRNPSAVIGWVSHTTTVLFEWSSLILVSYQPTRLSHAGLSLIHESN